MIDDLTIQKVKDAANIKDVVGQFYSLRKAGTDWECLCPFHSDRHVGSFKVNERKNIARCFSCGWSGGPVDFLMKHEALNFGEAIKWLGAMYSIEVDGSDTYKGKVAQCKPHEPAPPLPMAVMPPAWTRARMQGVEDSTLVKWLTSLPWSPEQRKRIPQMLRNYQVGVSRDGLSIFWQIDSLGKVRTGKLMRYQPDGHRDKSPGSVDFIHSRLIRARQFDPAEYEVKTCYFGEHLLNVCPDATVNVVESEKTALICAIYFGDLVHNLWVATGGLMNINRSKMDPYTSTRRVVCLYPDKDGVEKWKEKMTAIAYKSMRINTDVIRDHWIDDDGEKADIADIIVRLVSTPNKLQQLETENPAITELIKIFDCIEQ